MSNIRVAIEWKKPAVFAGEDLECVITFKNVAQVPNPKKIATEARNHNPPRERWKDNTSAHILHQRLDHASFQSSSLTHPKGHRNTSSLNSPRPPASEFEDENNAQSEQETAGQRHRRSVSIVSISGDSPSSERRPPSVSAPRRPGQGHGRAVSLHILPQRYTSSGKSPNLSNQTVDPPTPMRRDGPASPQDRAATEPALFMSSTFSTVDESVSAHHSWTREGK